MTRADQVRALYDSTLKPRIDALEGVRRELKTYIVKSAVLVGVPLAGFVLGEDFLPYPLDGTVPLVSFALIFVAVIITAKLYLLPGVTAFMNYRSRFKRDVVTEIFKIVVPSATYEPYKGIAREVFDEPGIFETRGGLSSDDRVRGRIGQTPFEAAEVSRSYTTGSGKNSKTHVVFKGLFFHLDFNKALRGTTIVEPENAGPSQIGDRDDLHLVSLENPEFEREFKVYATDDVEARYILTPVMMEQLLALRGHAEHPVFLGFKGSRAYIGIHYNRTLFEPSIASTTSLEAIEEFAEQFALAETVVHELDLNTRIWTKDVDDSLLHRPDEPTDQFKAALTTGDLQGSDVWRLAMAATGVQDEDDLQSPRPADTRIDVQQDVDGARIKYGLSFGFFFALIVSAACLMVAVLSARALDREYGPTIATPWLEQLPPTPIDALIAEAALGALPISCVIGAFFSLYWVLRVRRVVIRPDAVLISRGLRPLPRRYPRPPYGRVVRLDKGVYVGKLGEQSLLNSTASPMLGSEAEAKWVAAEMRRALRQTAR
jgi:hypothetical protein